VLLGRTLQTKRHDFKNIIQLFTYISCVYTKLFSGKFL